MSAAVAGMIGDRVLDASSLGKVIVSEASTRDNSEDEEAEAGSGSASASPSISRSQLSRGSSAVSGRLTVVNPDSEDGDSKARSLNDGEVSIMTASAITDDDACDSSTFIPDAIASPTLSDATVTPLVDTGRTSTSNREAEAVVVDVAKESDENNVEELVVLLEKKEGGDDGEEEAVQKTVDAANLAQPEPDVSVGTSLEASETLLDN